MGSSYIKEAKLLFLGQEGHRISPFPGIQEANQMSGHCKEEYFREAGWAGAELRVDSSKPES